MTNVKNVKFQQFTGEREKNIIMAANTYGKLKDTSISSISQMFNVSGNTIASWFCEAISKKYISDDICKLVIKKHVSEYESEHSLRNSSLRAMYKKAMDARTCNMSSSDSNKVEVVA